MVAIHETEQEQIEAIKKWWQENGAAVLIGITLGFALLFGWRYWQTYTHSQAEQASHIYQQGVLSVIEQQPDKAREAASVLLSQYSNSPYAALAALNLAAQELKEDNVEASQAHLQWVIDNGRLAELKHVAQVRKIKLLLSQDNIDEAQKVLNQTNDIKGFEGSYAELRGDIALAQNHHEQARQAYAEAVKDETLSPQQQELIQMKLDDLGLESAITALPPASPPPLPAETATPSTAQSSEILESEMATPVTPKRPTLEIQPVD